MATLLVLAAALSSVSPQAAPPPVPAAPPPAAMPAPRQGHMQIFVSPAGELFEAAADAPYPVAEWFARADGNHDGKLTEAEFVADFLQYFARLDLDHDGVIDGRELDRYETDMAPVLQTSSYAGSGYDGSDDGGGEDGEKRARSLGSYLADSPRGAGRFGLLRMPEPVASMDVTLKGRISRQQSQDAAEYRFSLLDSAQHGYLTLADLPETYAQGHRVTGSNRGRRNGGRHRESDPSGH